jgi:IS30 family transposase
MDHLHDTPSARKHKHLTTYERGRIQELWAQGYSAYAIGKRLNRASNTIRNELKRGTVPQIKAKENVMIYYPDTGQATYERNRKNCGPKFKYLRCSSFIRYVYFHFFKKKRSLDSICGVAKRHRAYSRQEMVCTKTLYNYVEHGILTIRNVDLPLKLKRSTKATRVRQNKKRLGTSISERPPHINDRSEFGHWEIDTVVGHKRKTEQALLTMTERMTRKTIIRKLPNRTAEAVQAAIDALIHETGDAFEHIFKSITSDNGSEFSALAKLEQTMATRVYFTHPYTSCERGTNERHNGLIRRFIPKGKKISQYPMEAIADIQTWCNTLPRKLLGYATPDEIFERQLKQLSLTS